MFLIAELLEKSKLVPTLDIKCVITALLQMKEYKSPICFSGVSVSWFPYKMFQTIIAITSMDSFDSFMGKNVWLWGSALHTPDPCPVSSLDRGCHEPQDVTMGENRFKHSLFLENRGKKREGSAKRSGAFCSHDGAGTAAVSGHVHPTHHKCKSDVSFIVCLHWRQKQ